MKLGVIADIHGNEQALRAVARDVHRRRHPNAAFIGAVLTGQREPYRSPSAADR